MNYTVKEIYYTLQGEGAQVGRPAVFCRFTGCNLWSGHEHDRATAMCDFCDTDFVGTDGPGGGTFGTATDLASAVDECWPRDAIVENRKFVVCTGGEPLLQVDSEFVEALHERGFEVAIETNGTRAAPEGIDWICVSPKAGAEFVLRGGDELKLVFPQQGIDPKEFEDLEFDHFFLQPMWGPDLEENRRLATEYTLQHPKWRVSLQVHKILGIP